MFRLICCFRVIASVLDGRFSLQSYLPIGWTHIVLNYIGPNDGQGIRIYNDATEKANDTSKYEKIYSPGDGRIVVGRYETDKDRNYVSVQVDELIFFNQALSMNDIKLLYNGN